jgi:16S rRNA (guanine966-N2)-methyltransferase
LALRALPPYHRGMSAHSRPSSSPAQSGDYQLRIIGGRWRGTKLHFPKIEAIRPTPDRVRETLFNWLQQDIVGAHVLDLFAGSGALGLESLSRGAAHAAFVDMEPAIVRYLHDTLARLDGHPSAQVLQGDALQALKQSTETFDVVFMDPPFALASDGKLFAALFAALQTPGRLSNHAHVYLECPAVLGAPEQWSCWPARWQLHRSKQAGQVGYHLIKVAHENGHE